MQIFGSNKKNKLFGELEADRMCGLDGDDELKGKDGNDELWGNAGADELWGEAGNDSVYGGKGSDFLVGDRGDDCLFGDGGHDILSGGEGSDTFTGGKGKDVFSISPFHHLADTDVITDFQGNFSNIDTLDLTIGYTYTCTTAGEDLELWASNGVMNHRFAILQGRADLKDEFDAKYGAWPVFYPTNDPTVAKFQTAIAALKAGQPIPDDPDLFWADKTKVTIADLEGAIIDTIGAQVGNRIVQASMEGTLPIGAIDPLTGDVVGQEVMPPSKPTSKPTSMPTLPDFGKMPAEPFDITQIYCPGPIVKPDSLLEWATTMATDLLKGGRIEICFSAQFILPPKQNCDRYPTPVPAPVPAPINFDPEPIPEPIPEPPPTPEPIAPPPSIAEPAPMFDPEPFPSVNSPTPAPDPLSFS